MPDTQAQEQLIEKWEDTDKKLERERLPHQDDWKNEKRQTGHRMTSNEVIYRVMKMNPSIWVEESKRHPENVGFYYASPLLGAKTFTGAHMKKGPVREFSLVKTDAADRPIGVEYGWREVLKRLLKLKLITWEQIKRRFPITESTPSAAFDEQTREERNA
jgi:hypothetical protein